MSTPSSSAACGTPSLTIPPTQNTAPVIKFRCLYTHDLRRKAKRWQDGFLRFHTFNKRVMVYDTAGNFVGDLHWRDNEMIQDGDELELDKGVLIQVGECLERTQSDISGLFEKKRQSQGSPPQKGAVPPSSRASTPRPSGVASQAPLKSLNDLLGIKKTPIGRSITPVSPYEQRHARAQAVENEQVERAAKRQRQLPPEDILHGKNPNEQIRSRPVTIDLEESTASAPPAKSISGLKVGSEKHDNARSSKVPSAPDRSQGRDSENPKSSSNPLSSLTSGSNTLRLNDDAPINALRIANEKPRKKLMYKALLPVDTASTDQNEAPKLPQSMTRSHQSEHARSSDHETQNATVQSAAEFTPSESTLFVLDEMIDEPVTTSSTREVKPSPTPEPNYLYAIPPHSAKDSASSDPPAAISAPTSRINQPAPRQQRAAVSDSAARQSSLFSRNNSHTTGTVQTEQPPRPPAAVNRSVAPPNHAGARKSPQKVLRKSLSDPTVLRSTDGNRSRPLSNNDQSGMTSNAAEEEQGPWTSEALDLFDWWPPGRPKPA